MTESMRSSDEWTVSPSCALIDAISTMEGVDPVDLPGEAGFTLYDYVDADALDELVETGDSVTISFSVDDYHVRIGDGILEVKRALGHAETCSGLTAATREEGGVRLS